MSRGLNTLGRLVWSILSCLQNICVALLEKEGEENDDGERKEKTSVR